MEEEVKLGVRGAITNKVMVSGVTSIDAEEGVTIDERSEKRDPGFVLWIDIEITAEEHWGVAKHLSGVGGDCFEVSKSRVKLRVFASRGKVDPNVGGGGEARDGKMEGEDGWGGGGEEGNKGVDGRVPDGKGSTKGSASSEREIRGVGIFSIEVEGVGRGELRENTGNVTGESLGFAEEY